MQDIDLHKWVNEAKQGHQTAWNYLYNYFNPYLYSKALAICGNSPEAKDSVQEAFMIAFLQLNKLKDPQAFPAWIKSILTHNCYRNIQKEKRTEQQDLLMCQQSDLNFEKKLDELYNNHKLFDSLEQLPEFLKTTVLLRYFSRHNSYEEMAAILSVPVGTIRSRLNKARIELSELWNKCNGEGFKLQQSEEWNRFYIWVFENYMAELEPRERLLNHLENKVQIRLTSGKQVIGKEYMIEGVEDDVIHGTGHDMVNVTTCGEVSVIDFNNINSLEFPDHCPGSSAVVVCRDKEKITRLHLYDSPR